MASCIPLCPITVPLLGDTSCPKAWPKALWEDCVDSSPLRTPFLLRVALEGHSPFLSHVTYLMTHKHVTVPKHRHMPPTQLLVAMCSPDAHSYMHAQLPSRSIYSTGKHLLHICALNSLSPTHSKAAAPLTPLTEGCQPLAVLKCQVYRLCQELRELSKCSCPNFFCNLIEPGERPIILSEPCRYGRDRLGERGDVEKRRGPHSKTRQEKPSNRNQKAYILKGCLIPSPPQMPIAQETSG